MSKSLSVYLDWKPFLDKKLRQSFWEEQTKVNIVLNLYVDSPLIILDEPTNGLEPMPTDRLKAT